MSLDWTTLQWWEGLTLLMMIFGMWTWGFAVGWHQASRKPANNAIQGSINGEKDKRPNISNERGAK